MISRTRSRPEKSRKNIQAQVDRYTKEQAEIEEQAKDFEAESARAQRKADRFDLGEVFLEIALVISSLALLSRKRIFWFLGIISGVAGLGVAVTGMSDALMPDYGVVLTTQGARCAAAALRLRA